MHYLRLLIHFLQFLIFYLIQGKSIIPKVALIWQENQRYKRYFQQQNIKLHFNTHEKLFIRSMFLQNKKASRFFTMVTAGTILYKLKNAVKAFWATDKAQKKSGRPPLSKVIKEIIKNMKINNYLWGCPRISDELKKLSIDACPESVRRVPIYHGVNFSKLIGNHCLPVTSLLWISSGLSDFMCSSLFS
jgi:hypothetical protein